MKQRYDRDIEKRERERKRERGGRDNKYWQTILTDNKDRHGHNETLDWRKNILRPKAVKNSLEIKYLEEKINIWNKNKSPAWRERETGRVHLPLQARVEITRYKEQTYRKKNWNLLEDRNINSLYSLRWILRTQSLVWQSSANISPWTPQARKKLTRIGRIWKEKKGGR